MEALVIDNPNPEEIADSFAGAPSVPDVISADHAPPQPSAGRTATARRAEPEPEVVAAVPVEASGTAKASSTVVAVADVLARRRAGARVDVVDLLPPAARERLEAMRLAADDARAATRAHADRLSDLRHRKRDAELRLRMLRAYPGSKIRDEDRPAAELISEITEVGARISKTDELVRERSERAGAISALVHRAEKWLGELPSTATLVDMEPLEPKLGKGEAVIDAIERCRRRVRELVADAHRVRSAPVPSAEAKRRIRAEIDRIAAMGEIDVSGAIEGGDVLRWPVSTHHIPITGAGVGSLVQVDNTAVMAWLFRDQLIARLEAEVDLVADDAAALDDTDRAARLAEIASDQLATEREEVALIETAARTGLTIAHRADVSIEALLGVHIIEQQEG
jgi:hypothetical protein